MTGYNDCRLQVVKRASTLDVQQLGGAFGVIIYWRKGAGCLGSVISRVCYCISVRYCQSRPLCACSCGYVGCFCSLFTLVELCCRSLLKHIYIYTTSMLNARCFGTFRISISDYTMNLAQLRGPKSWKCRVLSFVLRLPLYIYRYIY